MQDINASQNTSGVGGYGMQPRKDGFRESAGGGGGRSSMQALGLSNG